MSDRDLAARRLLAVTEEELQRIVLDIHDGPVQNLFAALSQLTLSAHASATFSLRQMNVLQPSTARSACWKFHWAIFVTCWGHFVPLNSPKAD
jgi:hypothetical protein